MTDIDANFPHSMGQIEEVVAEALARTLRIPLDRVRPESDLEGELGLDSMAMIHVNVAIEEKLHVALPACEAPEAGIRTVADLAAFTAATLERQDGRC